MTDLNIKSSTIEKGLELVKGLLDKIAAPAAEELGLIVSNNYKYRSLNNQIKNLSKVRKLVEANNMTLKQVNLKVLFPYLEGIAVEEDEELQDMWANLFVNYIDSNSSLKLTVYPSILKQLSTDEVRILKEASTLNEPEITGYYQRISYEEDNCQLLDNLERLGLMEHEKTIDTYNTYSINIDSYINYTGNYLITNFGLNFIDACTIKNNENDVKD